MLAHKFPACVLAVGADRVRVGAARVRDLEAETGESAADALSCVVVDDGLQQWRLAKDLEVIMVDALHPFGNGWLLPCGSLRESPRDALARADVVLVHHADLLPSSDQRCALIDTLRGCMDPSRSPIVATSRMKVVGLAPALGLLESGESAAVDESVDEQLVALRGSVALVVCGVGNPESVRLVVERLDNQEGERVWYGVEVMAFPDHHAFSRADVDDVLRRCRELESRPGGPRVVVLTTEKDLFRSSEPMLRLARRQETRVLQCELEVQQEAAAVHERLRRLLDPQ
jgi:tetraacyldisaccharide 4'-kinase